MADEVHESSDSDVVLVALSERHVVQQPPENSSRTTRKRAHVCVQNAADGPLGIVAVIATRSTKVIGASILSDKSSAPLLQYVHKKRSIWGLSNMRLRDAEVGPEE